MTRSTGCASSSRSDSPCPAGLVVRTREAFQGADRTAHAIPLADVTTVPASPTARNCVPDQVMPLRALDAPEVLAVHVVPSGEVTIVPASPTATGRICGKALRISIAGPLIIPIVAAPGSAASVPEGEERSDEQAGLPGSSEGLLL